MNGETDTELLGIEYRNGVPLTMHSKAHQYPLFLCKSAGRFLTPENQIYSLCDELVESDVCSVSPGCMVDFGPFELWVAPVVQVVRYGDKNYLRSDGWAGLPVGIKILDVPLDITQLLYDGSTDPQVIYNPAHEHALVDSAHFCNVCNDNYPDGDLCAHLCINDYGELYGVGSDEVPPLMKVEAGLCNYVAELDTPQYVGIDELFTLIDAEPPHSPDLIMAMNWIMGAWDSDEHRHHVSAMLENLNYWRSNFDESMAMFRMRLCLIARATLAVLDNPTNAEIQADGYHEGIGDRLIWLHSFVDLVLQHYEDGGTPSGTLSGLFGALVPRYRKKWSQRKRTLKLFAIKLIHFSGEGSDYEINRFWSRYMGVRG